MRSLDRLDRKMVIILAMLAGLVDAVGFISSGGFFLSFMSGNSTRLSIGIAEQAPYVGFVAALLLGFVSGVTIGSMIGWRGIVNIKHRQAKILTIMAIVLFAAPLVAEFGLLAIAFFLVTFSMGAENTLYERDGAVSFGLTYMTGALVKVGQGLATLFSGGEKFAWLPFLMLWFGLIGGAVTGASLFTYFGMFSLWAAALLSACCAGFLAMQN